MIHIADKPLSISSEKICLVCRRNICTSHFNMVALKRVVTSSHGITLVFFYFYAFSSEAKSICDICACNSTRVTKTNETFVNQTSVLNIACKNVYSKMVSRDIGSSRGTGQVWLTIRDNSFTPYKLKTYLQALKSRNLTYLILDHNKIDRVPEYFFQGLGNLIYLSLSNNNISKLNNETFYGLTNLKNIDIGNNIISTCDLDAFSVLNVHKLNLHSNKIKTILTLNSIASLREIDLSNNLLLELHTFGNALPNLEILNVSKNSVVNISSSFFEPLVMLKDLDLSYNKLTHFDLGDRALPSIRVINLQHNSLTRISITNSHEQLKFLNVNHNCLTTITILSNIEMLSMSHNVVLDCKTIRNLRNVKVLDVSYNKILEIPDELPVSLKELNLSGNKISTIPRLASLKTHNLVKLYLSHMPSLKELTPNTFEDFFPFTSHNENCTVLDLSNCSISKIDEQTFHAANLCKVNLSDNQISILPEKLMDWTDIEIDLQRNPLHCTCSSQWMIDTLVPSLYNLNPELLRDLRCGEPKEHSQKRLVHWFNHKNRTSLCRSSKFMAENEGNNVKDIKLTTSIPMILTLTVLGILAATLVWLGFTLQRKYTSSPVRNRRFMK